MSCPSRWLICEVTPCSWGAPGLEKEEESDSNLQRGCELGTPPTPGRAPPCLMAKASSLMGEVAPPLPFAFVNLLAPVLPDLVTQGRAELTLLLLHWALTEPPQEGTPVSQPHSPLHQPAKTGSPWAVSLPHPRPSRSLHGS